MEDEDGEITPGFYDFTKEELGAARAETEQKRAEILDVLRTSECFTVHALDKDNNEVLNATMILGINGNGGDHEPDVFLCHAALKLIQDLSVVLNEEPLIVLKRLELMIKKGVMKEWEEE